MSRSIEVESGPVKTAPAPRSEQRRFVGLLVIACSTALCLGLTLRTPSQLEANDISRWCTVWSLLEKRTYAIDEAPWQAKTQDKVKKPDKLTVPEEGSGALRRLEYALAPRAWKDGEPVDHFYSSKPPLLPTLIAGLLYPARVATGVPLGNVVDQPRVPRYVQKEVPGSPGKSEFVLETPKEAVHWPVYVFYFKPIIVLLNLVPFLIVLVLYGRLLDRTAETDWSWFTSLFTAGMGTLLFTFNQTLNNHTVAAWSAFFAIYLVQSIWADGKDSRVRFATAGFAAAFCACNELPAAIFGVLLFLTLLVRYPSRTLIWFGPAAAVPCIAFIVTQFLAFGQFKPVYEEFGTKSYTYYGSYWNTPLEMDWFNQHPEPYGIYLLNMTVGHHGIFSLTPIFIFAVFGGLREIVRRGKLSGIAWMALILTIAMFAFYTWNPKARNYGGSTQGLRWLFWLIPFWLFVLPSGLEAGQRNRFIRALSLAALVISVASVGYALRYPWSHPWILDALEHLNLYTLTR